MQKAKKLVRLRGSRSKNSGDGNGSDAGSSRRSQSSASFEENSRQIVGSDKNSIVSIKSVENSGDNAASDLTSSNDEQDVETMEGQQQLPVVQQPVAGASPRHTTVTTTHATQQITVQQSATLPISSSKSYHANPSTSSQQHLTAQTFVHPEQSSLMSVRAYQPQHLPVQGGRTSSALTANNSSATLPGTTSSMTLGGSSSMHVVAGSSATGGAQEFRGWLYKWTNYLKGYQKRFFVLTNGLLSYYRTPAEMSHTCRGAIKLAGAIITPTPDSCNFTVSNRGTQTFHLKAGSENDRNKWVAALELAKSRAIRAEESSDEEKENTMEDHRKELETLMSTLTVKLEDLQTCNDLIVKHGTALQKTLAELEKLNEPQECAAKSRTINERATLFRVTCAAMLSACNEYLKIARNDSGRWQKLLTTQQEKCQRLENLIEQMARQYNQLEEKLRAASAGRAVRSRSIHQNQILKQQLNNNNNNDDAENNDTFPSTSADSTTKLAGSSSREGGAVSVGNEIDEFYDAMEEMNDPDVEARFDVLLPHTGGSRRDQQQPQRGDRLAVTSGGSDKKTMAHRSVSMASQESWQAADDVSEGGTLSGSGTHGGIMMNGDDTEEDELSEMNVKPSHHAAKHQRPSARVVVHKSASKQLSTLPSSDDAVDNAIPLQSSSSSTSTHTALTTLAAQPSGAHGGAVTTAPSAGSSAAAAATVLPSKAVEDDQQQLQRLQQLVPFPVKAADIRTVKRRAPKKRRSRIPDRPNQSLNLWSVLKNCIGRDLTRIPMPVNFSEPLSMLQRLTEDYEYSDLLDKAARCNDPCEQLVYIASFIVSAYATTSTRTNKPFNPLLGETFEFDRTDDLGWRSLCEQVCHHPPIAALHVESDEWLSWAEWCITSKFRGKYLQVVPQGVTHLLFKRTGTHYTWRRVTTTVHNIVVGKLWLDHSGELEIRNFNSTGGGGGAAAETCLLKFHAYSYFSREAPKKVTGVVTDKQDRPRFVLNGTWDESMEMARVRGSRIEDKSKQHVIDTEPAELVWQRRYPPEEYSRMYNFTEFAIALNEPDEGVAPTDARFRPDQRLMEQGRWDEANRIKIQLEEKQRTVRRDRETQAERAAVEGGADYHGHSATWFRRVVDPQTNEPLHVFTGDYWDCKERGDWSRCPNIYV